MILSQEIAFLSQVRLGQDKYMKLKENKHKSLKVVPILNGTSNIRYLRDIWGFPIFLIGKRTNLIYREPGTNGF